MAGSGIESVLDWATVRKYRTGENPARWKGHLDKLLPARSKVKKTEHHAALPWLQIGAFMVKLREQEGVAAKAVELAILTACRSGEVRGAVWEEFDLEADRKEIRRYANNRLFRVALQDSHC